MPTTSNFGWTTPADTDLVKDGAAAIRTLGNGIDTSLVDLKGGTTGQILSKASNTDLDYTWITNDVGDITNVGVTSPITGGGSSGSVTIGIQDGTTAQKGAVQLENSTSSTSTTTAAVPASVKSAYDLADGAIPKSLVDAKGDLIVGTADNTVARLASSASNGNVLTVDTSTASGLKWAAPAASGFVGCKVKMTADLAVANNTEVTVTFGGEEFDTDSFHSTSTNTSRITIPTGKGGKYLFTAQFFMTIGDTSAFIVYTFLNGNKIGRAQARPGSTGFISIGVTDIFNLVATDYIEYVVAQTSGSTQDLKATESTSLVTYAAAQYLGA